MDANVHANDGPGPASLSDRPADFTGERHEPALPGSGDCRRHDPCRPLLEASSELPGGLMPVNAAESRQRDVVAVGLDADGAGGEPTGLRSTTLVLPYREPHAPTDTASVLGVLPVLERPGQAIEARRVCLLRVLSPPGSRYVLGLVPFSPQLHQAPGHLDVLPGHLGLQAPLKQLQAPVVGESARADVAGEHASLTWGWVQGVPVRLEHDGRRRACHGRTVSNTRSVAVPVSTGGPGPAGPARSG